MVALYFAMRHALVVSCTKPTITLGLVWLRGGKSGLTSLAFQARAEAGPGQCSGGRLEEEELEPENALGSALLCSCPQWCFCRGLSMCLCQPPLQQTTG